MQASTNSIVKLQNALERSPALNGDLIARVIRSDSEFSLRQALVANPHLNDHHLFIIYSGTPSGHEVRVKVAAHKGSGPKVVKNIILYGTPEEAISLATGAISDSLKQSVLTSMSAMALSGNQREFLTTFSAYYPKDLITEDLLSELNNNPQIFRGLLKHRSLPKTIKRLVVSYAKLALSPEEFSLLSHIRL